jgi:hypothetical protein
MAGQCDQLVHVFCSQLGRQRESQAPVGVRLA